VLAHSTSNAPLSAQLWEQNLAIAQQVLATPFIRALADGTLSPDVYGSFVVQDIYYCGSAQDDYVIGIARVQRDPSKNNLTAFFLAQYESYIAYNKAYYDTWHIANYSGITPEHGTASYADLEEEVAVNYPPELLVVVMTPCDVLWDWLGTQLLTVEGVQPTNPYYPFIRNMLDPKGAKKFNDFIDYLASSIDVDQAFSVYKGAMLGELGMFTQSISA